MSALLTVLALALARLIAGEAGICGYEAKIAVAHVAHNRIEAGMSGGWYGDADPQYQDIAAALYWQSHADPTGGALFLVNNEDEQLPEVQAFLADCEPVAVYRCAGDQQLRAWRIK